MNLLALNALVTVPFSYVIATSQPHVSQFYLSILSPHFQFQMLKQKSDEQVIQKTILDLHGTSFILSCFLKLCLKKPKPIFGSFTQSLSLLFFSMLMISSLPLKTHKLKISENIPCDSRNSDFLFRITQKTAAGRFEKSLHPNVTSHACLYERNMPFNFPVKPEAECSLRNVRAGPEQVGETRIR